MKVCLVTTAFPRWVGDGEGAFIWEAVRAIARQGAQMRVIAMHSPGARRHEYMEGIEIVRPRYLWPERWEMLRREGAAGIPATWQKHPLVRPQLFPFILVHALTTAYLARDYDVIHAQWTLSAGAAHLGKWFHRRPILATVQGSDILQATRHPVGAWLTRSVLSGCNHITALSQALVATMVAMGVSSDKIDLVPNGVDSGRFVPPANGERSDIILYVGSLIERKGVKHLLDAMPEVFRLFPRYQLILIGNGPQRALLKQMANDLGIAERVKFLDFQPQDQILFWMQRAKLLVLPSLEEAQGVVLLEAMSCGTPVIASHVGGIPDMVTPDVGVLVPPANPEALSEAIAGILGNSLQWAILSHQARERVVRYYDWNHIAKRFIAFYNALMIKR